MNEYRKWWTHCPDCDAAFTVESRNPIGDPDDADEWMSCPYDGALLTGWNGDPE